MEDDTPQEQANCTNDGSEAQNITDMDVTVPLFEEPHIVEEVSMEDDDPLSEGRPSCIVVSATLHIQS